MSGQAPNFFLLGSVTLEDEGDVWVAAGYADDLEDDGIPPEALPLVCAPLGEAAVIFLIVDGVIRGFVRQSEKPLSWLDFGWLCATWPHARMVWIVPLAELDEGSATVLTSMAEFTDGQTPADGAEQQGGGGQ